LTTQDQKLSFHSREPGHKARFIKTKLL